jgi:hypothetical protein
MVFLAIMGFGAAVPEARARGATARARTAVAVRIVDFMGG